MAERFTRIVVANRWRDPDSRSGTGSNLAQTDNIRFRLPGLVEDLGARVLLDAPCGDFYWMSHTRLPVESYIGVDVVSDVIEGNRTRYSRPGRSFQVCDITAELLPRADLILCRDCLVHFSFEDAFAAIRGFKMSGATYLLCTTFVDTKENVDIVTSSWRPLNLQLPPFCFPEPLELLTEGCTEIAGNFADKSLGLWRLQDIGI